MQRTRPRMLGLVIAKHGLLAALLFGPPAIWALVESFNTFALTLLIPIILGALVWLATRSKELPKDLHGVEAMISVALLFFIAPVFALPAFMSLGLPPAAAFFEGMSAITTTGLSMARAPDDWPFAAHILRSWMQWCGGLAMATAVLALVLGPGPAANTMGKFGIDDRNRIQSARSQARELLGAYAILTILSALLIALAIGNWQEGLALALSGISTGGFAPRSDSLASYDLIGQIAVILTCLCGAVSLLAFAQCMRRDGLFLPTSPSPRRVLVTGALLAIALAALMLALGETSGFAATLLNLLSAFTTAGYATDAMPTSPALLVLFIIAMVIGGDRGSTAGGLKLSRIATILRAVKHGLTLPRLPERAVSPLRENGAKAENTYIVTILAVVALYTISVLAVWLMLIALGQPALPSLFDTVSALSTVGLSTGVISPDLPASAQLVLTFAMWLGRLEFIAVIVLFLPSTWLRHKTRKG